MKKIAKIIIAATLLCGAMVLVACGNGDAAGGVKEYKVTVKDALGNPYTSGVVVQFYKGEEQAGMQKVDEKTGIATKELEAGDYTVKLQFTDGADGYHYEEEGLKLSADKTELDVILAKKVADKGTALFVGNGEYEAYAVGVGCTYVELTAGERNYFLFTPTKAGTYEFSIADGADVTIGYYGAPHFVQANNVAETVDNKFKISIKDSMIGGADSAGTSVYVIGIEPKDGVKNCVLAINRTGDPEWSVEDEPWITYQATAMLSKFTLPAGTTLADFDVTAPTYNLVYNEFDGYYHLNSEEGPLVYVNLTEDSAYLASFKNILDRSGVVKYFFNEKGEFEKKESYSECLLKYIENADEETGVYPLTEDLKYIIQSRGEYVGWWNSTSSQFIFKDPMGNAMTGLNTENAWLFMCCYEE